MSERIGILFDSREAAVRLVEAMYGRHRHKGETADLVLAALDGDAQATLHRCIMVSLAYLDRVATKDIPPDRDELAVALLAAITNKVIVPKDKTMTSVEMLALIPGRLPDRCRRAADALFKYVGELALAAGAQPPEPPTKH